MVKEGYYADLVIFDPVNIQDSLDYGAVKYPKGIKDVFVNGERVVKNGAHTKKRPGKVLRTN